MVLIEELKAAEVMVQMDCLRSSLQLKIFSELIEAPGNISGANKYIEEIHARAGALNAFIDIEMGSKGAWFLLEVRT